MEASNTAPMPVYLTPFRRERPLETVILGTAPYFGEVATLVREVYANNVWKMYATTEKRGKVLLIIY